MKTRKVLNNVLGRIYENRDIYETWNPLIMMFPWPRFLFSRFQSHPIWIERLPDEMAVELVSAMMAASSIPFRNDSALPQYLASNIPEYVDTLNRDHKYLRFDKEQLAATSKALKWLIPKVARKLGHPIRVVNVRAWKTAATNQDLTGPNGWHRDGMPKGIYKLLIYLTETGKSLGTTEIQTEQGQIIEVSGPPGTFLLFDNNSLLHRGVAPRPSQDFRAIVERGVIEVTVIPYFKCESKPIVAGLNARYPKRPWARVPADQIG